MRCLLDTNVWIDAHAGKPDAGRVFAQARATQGAWVGFSSITKLEALGYSGLTAADDKALRELLAQFEEVPILPAVIDEAIRLRRLHKLKTPDAIVAATALLQQAELVTRNTGDFKKVGGLTVLDTRSF
jgi:predicted nucleic acid-binding protein